ncbi:MAG TPA: hypothetical protein VMU39_22300 [Solirubrobacteraceae bacterium]|nr:hypothetical protein [Solirubrobacteraceae bacterium]
MNIAVITTTPGARNAIYECPWKPDDGGRAVPSLLQALEAHGIPVAEVRVARPSLDDVYLRYTGRTFDAAEAEAQAAEVNR